MIVTANLNSLRPGSGVLSGGSTFKAEAAAPEASQAEAITPKPVETLANPGAGADAVSDFAKFSIVQQTAADDTLSGIANEASTDVEEGEDLDNDSDSTENDDVELGGGSSDEPMMSAGRFVDDVNRRADERMGAVEKAVTIRNTMSNMASAPQTPAPQPMASGGGGGGGGAMTGGATGGTTLQASAGATGMTANAAGGGSLVAASGTVSMADAEAGTVRGQNVIYEITGNINGSDNFNGSIFGQQFRNGVNTATGRSVAEDTLNGVYLHEEAHANAASSGAAYGVGARNGKLNFQNGMVTSGSVELTNQNGNFDAGRARNDRDYLNTHMRAAEYIAFAAKAPEEAGIGGYGELSDADISIYNENEGKIEQMMQIDQQNHGGQVAAGAEVNWRRGG